MKLRIRFKQLSRVYPGYVGMPFKAKMLKA